MPALAIIGCVLSALTALWILANAKKSRPDGTFVKNLHPYRQIMQYVMPTRTESAVYINVDLRVERLEAYLEKAKGAFGANVTHCIVAAVYVALARMPALNRFVVGRRLYQRDGVWLSFSMKRKKQNQAAKLAVVKLRMQEGEDFPSLVARINEQIGQERSGKKTYADKEYDLFNLLPRPVLRGAAAFLRWLDYYNLLPGSFIHPDSLYTSMVIANVGSLQLPAGYHHLYEWGNSPFFLMVGQIEDRAVIENGVPVAARVLPMKVTFDERVEDGLTAGIGIRAFNAVLGNPERTLGGLAEDGSDRHPIWPQELD
jgi:pyruvate/2-oxoglutarate dehydrogenase complex dihydrolipoamide acyltransferase (E2) component